MLHLISKAAEGANRQDPLGSGKLSGKAPLSNFSRSPLLILAREKADAAVRCPNYPPTSLALARRRAWQCACSEDQFGAPPLLQFRGTRVPRRNGLHGSRQLGNRSCR